MTEELGRLRDEIRTLAADVSTLHQTERAVDKKVFVIGRALLDQKQVLDTVTVKQDAWQAERRSFLAKANEKQAKLEASADTILTKTDALLKTKEREVALLTSLETLSEEQAEFAKRVDAFQTVLRTELNSVKDTVTSIVEHIGSMDIADQTAMLQTGLTEIKQRLQAYELHRKQVTEAMAREQAEAENRIESIQADMEKQRMAIAVILKISATCEEKVSAFCDRLEELLRTGDAKTEPVTLSLEDLFAPPAVTEPVVEAASVEKKKRFRLFGRK